jgi:hypothetical protein
MIMKTDYFLSDRRAYLNYMISKLGVLAFQSRGCDH